MKRKSDLVRHQLPKNFPHNDSEFQYVRRQAKRNYTTLRMPDQVIFNDEKQFYKGHRFWSSEAVVSGLIQWIVNGLEQDIQKIQNRRMIISAVGLTNSIAFGLETLQDPQKSFDEQSKLPEQQPCRNHTDPISGFNKQNFIKKPLMRHKYSKEMSLQNIRDGSQVSISQPNAKKLPPLMKQLSQQKMQVFVPLDDLNGLKKKQNVDLDEIVRERLLKQIENRRFKEKIEAISKGGNPIVQDLGTKKNPRSTHNSVDKFNSVKEDFNFDYDGNKIAIYNFGKVKSNLKILKTLYKVPKERPEQKPQKLQKKFHERISYVPRGSRQYMQINNRTISDLGDLNYSVALKQKIEHQLRKTDIKFVEKQYFGKEKERRDSVVA